MDDVNEQPGLWNRIKSWFGIGSRRQLNLPVGQSTSFLPWRRHDAAVANLQTGFNALTQLLVTIRENLEQQTRQQQELSQHLANLSENSFPLPPGSPLPEDAARGIVQQMAYQGQQQHRIGNILEKLSDSTAEQGRLLNALGERTETLEHHDRLIGDNLQSVGIAMQSVSRNSEQNTQVLQAMRQQMAHNDDRLHNTIGRHGDRLTILLIITMILSAVALLAVLILGLILFRTRTAPAHSAPAASASSLAPSQSPSPIVGPGKSAQPK